MSATAGPVPDGNTTSPFPFPKHHSYPPLYTRQPTLATRQAQLARWSSLIQRYCRHHKLFTLVIIDTLDSPLFHNAAIRKRLSQAEVTAVIEHMVSQEGRAEWVDADKASAWIWWRKPEEWAGLVAAWVEETGQKGTVLTLYELVEGEASVGQEFYGLDMRVLRRALDTMVKKGRAQVFGAEDSMGVKFF
jgi:ESCRT-II complex subunit VPS25